MKGENRSMTVATTLNTALLTNMRAKTPLRLKFELWRVLSHGITAWCTWLTRKSMAVRGARKAASNGREVVTQIWCLLYSVKRATETSAELTVATAKFELTRTYCLAMKSPTVCRAVSGSGASATVGRIACKM